MKLNLTHLKVLTLVYFGEAFDKPISITLYNDLEKFGLIDSRHNITTNGLEKLNNAMKAFIK